MKKIKYIEVDEQNGMLKVPSEIVGKVAQLIKQTIGIDIVEIPIEDNRNNEKNIKQERQIIVKLLHKFHKYCRNKSLNNLDNELTRLKLRENNFQRFKYSDIYELSNKSHIKEEFKLEWELFLSSGKALEALKQVHTCREELKKKNTKLISLFLFECQKTVPYQSFCLNSQLNQKQ